ncbi:hypothetical protein B0T19DRAFT_162968 [Cercophora scortea]|uniref:Secreted protein n=1 Tax=Cercophora scortea TaxID=314031 RepID=A0AAE0IMD0_9PEZI|nr:hypothetical protein B0T19DRAFT_162968 [Cercophora scortea]
MQFRQSYLLLLSVLFPDGSYAKARVWPRALGNVSRETHIRQLRLTTTSLPINRSPSGTYFPFQAQPQPPPPRPKSYPFFCFFFGLQRVGWVTRAVTWPDKLPTVNRSLPSSTRAQPIAKRHTWPRPSSALSFSPLTALPRG